MALTLAKKAEIKMARERLGPWYLWCENNKCYPKRFKRLQRCNWYHFIKQRVMDINIIFQNLTKSELTKTHL
jgi:hypothetical protein